MAHGQEVRDQVRRAYIYERLSLDIAASQAGVAFATASRWKRAAAEAGDDWDKLRSANLLAGAGLEEVGRQALTGFMIQYQATMEALCKAENIEPGTKVEMLASLADAFNKTVSASKRVLPETSELGTAMEVVQKLAEFVRARFPKHVHAFAEILEPFGEELAKTYG